MVSINGAPVAWSSWTPGQIKFAVPAGVSQGSVLAVSCNGTVAWSFNGLNVATELPGILTADGAGAGQAAATNADGSTNSASNAATCGSSISVLVTGFGAFGDTRTDGQRHLMGAVTAQIGDQPATVSYAELYGKHGWVAAHHADRSRRRRDWRYCTAGNLGRWHTSPDHNDRCDSVNLIVRICSD